MTQQVSAATQTVPVSPHTRPTLSAFLPLLRAGLWAATGFTVLALATALLQGTPRLTQAAVTTGYLGGLTGWLLGSGAWEAGLKPFFGGERRWDEGHGWARYFRFNTDHKVVGLQYLVTAVGTFLLAGLVAMLIRTELATPDRSLFATNQQYNTAVGVHGTLMLFAVAVVGIVGGFGNYFVPLLIGAEDMVFPRVNALSYWFIPAGVFAIAASPLLGGFQTGWTGYAPLAATDASGQLLYYLGVLTLGTSSVLTAVNVTATIVYLRAPGLTWKRLPMFAWAMLVTSILNVLWVPVASTAMVMGLLDRIVPTAFFKESGLPLLWQDLFWLFGHPEVYIIILPAFGIWLEIIPVMARKTLFAYRWAVAGFVLVGVMSGIVWVHHMFTGVAAERLVPFMTTTELISVPTGFMYLAALGTLWRGRIRVTTPMLLILMSLFNFLIGGVTGVFLADAPADLFLHDTYFVVSHFHYTIIGGMIFAWVAGWYYWFPKVTGRRYDERWGRALSWMLFLGFNGTFLPMFYLGANGMNRRVAEYPAYLGGVNLVVSLVSALLGIAFVGHVVHLLLSWIHGRRTVENPWGGKTLEWQTTSPPPKENFSEEPIVDRDFYSYGAVAAKADQSMPKVSG